MSGEDTAPNRRARLEQARAHGDVLHVEHCGCFGRRAPFDVAEDEHFALPHWKRPGDRLNELDGTLAVDACAGIGDIDVLRGARYRLRGFLSRSEGDTTCDAIQPPFEWSVATKARELAMHAYEHFLRDV